MVNKQANAVGISVQPSAILTQAREVSACPLRLSLENNGVIVTGGNAKEGADRIYLS